MNQQQFASKQIIKTYQNSENREFQRGRGYAIKIFFSLFLCAGFLTYRFAYTMDLTKQCLDDWLHGVLMPVNIWIDQDPYVLAIVIGQSLLQFIIAWILTINMIWCKNMRVLVFLVIYFVMRNLVVFLVRFPFSDHIVWRSPPFFFPESFDLKGDFFFSGHMGMAVLSTMETIRLKCPKWIIFVNYTTIVWMFFMLISTRIHYTIDLLAAPFYVFLANDIGKALGHWPDYLLSFPYIFGKKIKECFCFNIIENQNNQLIEETLN